jgi:dolichyl-diphosphooligosaccharide--protein glycosyltransferase
MVSALLGLLRWPLVLLLIMVQLYCLAWFLFAAYEIRMYPIKDFGYTIHEFDPWFNYRAAEYLAEHGISKFNKWYDYRSWYPMGRPIGTTIYPGMQITAVAIWEGMKHAPVTSIDVPKELRKLVGRTSKFFERLGFFYLPYAPKKLVLGPMTVNEICCMIPPWFGSLASFFCGLLTFEVSRSTNAALLAVGVMSVIPAHLMRSVGGKFDNEAIAMAAICSTFWLWLRSVRTPSSWPVGLFAALSYIYMVAAWGGYIFVLNMIGIHALMLVCLGRFNSGVHKAYSIFYCVGTFGAMQIPVVGWTPLRSIEQLGPMGVFLGYQALAYIDAQRRKRNMDATDVMKFRIKVFGIFIAGLLVVICLLAPTGYFGPLSSRIRGLFMKHTKTGNPLVDSVAEHQPASAGIYASYLNLPLDYVAYGGLVCLFKRNNGAYFVLLYGFIASHFSGKMSRLVLICAPIVAVVCAIWLGFLLDIILDPIFIFLGKRNAVVPDSSTEGNGHKGNGHKEDLVTGATTKGKNQNQGGKSSGRAQNQTKKNDKRLAFTGAEWKLEEWEDEYRPGGIAQFKRILKSNLLQSMPEDLKDNYSNARQAWNGGVLVRAAVGFLTLFYVMFPSGAYQKTLTFLQHCDSVAQSMSSAQVKFKSSSGQIVDDPWAGYKWLAANTPKDSRVFAWWDYGYQITGIGERISLADGNTWNHEQIATLGKLLSSPQKKSHNSLRHLADYVLIWAQKDLQISTHFGRIGNSVFPDHCGDADPSCTKYGFEAGDTNRPTPMMKKSLVYNLVKHKEVPGTGAHPSLFEEVHYTKNRMLRIFKVLNVSQESREWVADPKNKICDAPGSWYCVGQYPPALDKLLQQRRSFSQVEDFNKKGEKSAYTKMIEKQRGGGEF